MRFRDCEGNHLFLKRLTLQDSDHLFPEEAFDDHSDGLEAVELETFALLLATIALTGRLAVSKSQRVASKVPAACWYERSDSNTKRRTKDEEPAADRDTDYTDCDGDSGSELDELSSADPTEWHDCGDDLHEAPMWITD
jgi:hypothetical protein